MQIDPHIAKCKRKLSSRLPRCLSNEEHDTPRISLFELFDGPSVIRQMQRSRQVEEMPGPLDRSYEHKSRGLESRYI